MHISTILLASVLGCTPASDTSVVGFWESAAPSRGGIGHSLELRANGEFLSATIVIVDQAFRVTGGKLFVGESPKALDSATDGKAFQVDKDVLVETGGTGGEIRKERVGAPPRTGSPLIGAWRYRHYTGAIAFERYTDDGRLLFRLPMTSQLGCFGTANGALSLDSPDRKATTRYTLVPGTLTLYGTASAPHAYRRADPWYPRDKIDYQPSK